jgi:serine/threonine-protein kinase
MAGGLGVVLPYYVMPYIDGETLRERLARERQLPLTDALQITREVSGALDYAHGRGIVHRDIKPSNILLGGGHAVVADFGIARAITVSAGEELTETGLAVGTPEYMSPEQASGEGQVDGRSDIYALGCLLYEMLAGEPPFRGRTAQVVFARHRHEPPPSLSVVRPNLPLAIEVGVRRALAKVAADRYATAAEFIRALEREEPVGRTSRSLRRFTGPLVALAVLGLALTLWLRLTAKAQPLNANRVVVFPLNESESEAAAGGGEAVATYIGYALEGTEPLKWLDGLDFLTNEQRTNIAGLSTAQAREISRRQSAAFYLDGAIIPGSDSVTIVLRLHDVRGDSILRRTGASAMRGSVSLPQLGVQAVGALLPALLEPGSRVDLTALSERDAGAVANFLQGEREYRGLSFNRALDHYTTAVKQDSGLALAALKGAMAASWQERVPDAERFLDVALRAPAALPTKYRVFGLGLAAYIQGHADSAVLDLKKAVDLDPLWPEAWTLLGETYYHLIPRAFSLDSLALSAFANAIRVDSTFIPALYHVTEAAARRGDVDSAARLLTRLRVAGVDSVRRLPLELMLACISGNPDTMSWSDAVARHTPAVLAAAQALAAGAASPACARGAFQAVLASETLESRWGALLGLQSLLIAEGRSDELRALLASPSVSDLPATLLFLWDVTADSALHQDAAEVAREQGNNYDTMSTPNLWLLGQWESYREDTAGVRRIEEVLRDRAERAGRVDSLVAAIFAAHLSRIRGDTLEAVKRLESLSPSAPRADLMWQPWEALAPERAALARLLLARGEFDHAYQVAAELESQRSVAFLPYLRPSLGIRMEAAESLRRSDLVELHRRRLVGLRAHSLRSVSSTLKGGSHAGASAMPRQLQQNLQAAQQVGDRLGNVGQEGQNQGQQVLP